MRYYIATMQHETQCTTYSPLVFVYKLDVYAPTRPQSCCRLPTGKSRHTPKHCKGDLKKNRCSFSCVCVCGVCVCVPPHVRYTKKKKHNNSPARWTGIFVEGERKKRSSHLLMCLAGPNLERRTKMKNSSPRLMVCGRAKETNRNEWATVEKKKKTFQTRNVFLNLKNKKKKTKKLLDSDIECAIFSWRVHDTA